ncbi:MAG: twin-arginine translocation pathway signal [Variovorax sp.]|jgi:tripartite-type tricarboxylate transporter receptor subunit TctC|nr:twin-arginine translocation pathway signal [Variovorax sp.]
MRKLLMAVLGGLALTVQAQAQGTGDYPTRPIRFILISAAGSGGDTLGRLLADKMAPLIKGTFVLDNKPGASGAIAASDIARAAPDGYTIGIGGATTHVLLPASNPKLSYDSVKDFAPIGQVGTASILLIATNDFPASNVKELVALSKKSPGSVQYASWGVGSTGHFCGELLNLRTQAHMSHIPYKSVVQIQTDMLGGHIKLAYVDMASGSPMVKAGKVKAITACTSRSPSLPDVASYDDEGIDFAGKRMGALRWALYAPAATPKPIVDKLSAALKQVVEMPDVKARLLDLGITSAYVGGDELRSMTAADIESWKQIAKAANITNE